MRTEATASTATTLTLTARDGYRLGATLYPGCGETKGNLIVANATGVPQGFYRRFAEFASKRGYNVLTLDYRGVGQSRPASLRGFSMQYLDWARLDLAAAVDHLAASRLKIYWIGHSFGGHAIGLLPNHDRLTAACCFATGAGWAGWMPRLEGLKVRFLWSVVLPVLVRSKGYLAWSGLGMGADLPLGVYRDWKRWCQRPHYFFDFPEMQSQTAGFAQVQIPLRFVNALDDTWALPAAREAFIQGYNNAPIERVDLPAGKGLPGIGHMGYFRPGSEPFWDQALDWFEQSDALV